MLNVTEIRCKQACNKINSGDLPFSWDLNIYRGCQHGCIYCYAIYSHDYLSTDTNYYEDIYVKINIVEQLEKQLRSPSWKREKINIGGVTDSYQPLEAKYKLMPDILKLLIKYKTPCTISTKSDLILRDYDLLDELSRITSVNIGSTITTVDDNVRKKIEPVGKNASAKFNMLKEFSKTNVTTGLHQMPIIPYITDSRENIEQLYARAADSKVNSCLPGVLYLRGKTRGVFFDSIRREYPDLLKPLTELYRKGGASKEYKSSLYEKVSELRRKYRLSSYYVNTKKEKMVKVKESEGYTQISLFDMNTHQNYSPASIPKREELAETKPPDSENQAPELNLDPFVEIEVGEAKPTYNSITLPTVQPMSTVTNEKRALFYSMRQIARDTQYYADHSRIFYKQAVFMKDFEDDYAETTQFSSYFPYYQRMGYEQLRTYFTWRTQIRSGVINSTSISYAFLYIYELLNQIGVEGPEDGLNKLMTFWQSFRVYDSVIDQYVLAWLKDYHIYYPLPHSFGEFAHEHNLTIHYPTIFGYKTCKQDSFNLFTSISKYDIKKSVFYNDETSDTINDCFHFILERFRKHFHDKKKCFEDLIFYPLSKKVTWTPFSRALFYPAFKQSNREVDISEKEVYNCTENSWQYKSVILSENGRQLVSYIIKEMECSLRQAVKFKYKLTANPNICDDKTRTKLEKIGIALPQFIQMGVSEFYTMITRKVVSVDSKNLHQIRQEALQTQEKLIVPEENTLELHEVKQSAPIQKPQVAPPSVSDTWSEFKVALTQVELETLELLLREKSIKTFAMQKMIMLEVLVDGINQKAMDYIGDTLLELDETVIIYEEYQPNLKKIVL